ncbi:MAG TPA: SGNH/GDSL hydrolase family protein [Verrucomicrobiae bacterium]|nr:SGNH/GDSL hydrolase family protein [Verrucomicrobiae bacterium]
MTPFRRAAANLALALTSTCLFFAALEGGARTWDRIRNGTPFFLPDPASSLYEPHPYLPLVLRPDSDYRDNDTAGHINALGLRGPERPAGKAPGTYRVICVGGSTTFGAGIVGDENTWPARLEAKLAAARPDLKIEVWNAGVPGYTSAENVIYLSLRLVDFRPDLVVLYEGYNDFKPNRHPGFRSDYAHWRDREAAPQRSPLDRLRFYVKMKALADRLTADPSEEVKDVRTGGKLKRFDTVSQEGLAAFRRNLETMIAVARRAGADVAVATYAHPCTESNLASRPDLFTYLPGYLPSLTFRGVVDAFGRYNDAVRSVAATDRAHLADAARAMPADPSLFVDHVHFNARGAELFAQVVAGTILPTLPGATVP